MDVTDDEEEVTAKIVSNKLDEDGEPEGFPQLKEVKGFEMLYCAANSRDLCLLKCSHAAKVLRSNISGQSKIYLRPIQINLSTKSKTIERTESLSVLREECKICSNLIPVNELRTHFTKCADSAISKSDSESSYISNDEEGSTQRGPAVVCIGISDQSSELLPSTVAVPELIGPFIANSNLAHSTPEAVDLTNDDHFSDIGLSF